MSDEMSEDDRKRIMESGTLSTADLIKMLRWHGTDYDFMPEAADEIERLQAEVARLTAALRDMVEISTRNSEASLMLIAIRKCAEHALAK